MKLYSITELQNIIKAELDTRSEELKKMNPIKLYRPVDYSLEMGGKRLRPALLLMAYNMFSDSVQDAIPGHVICRRALGRLSVPAGKQDVSKE